MRCWVALAPLSLTASRLEFRGFGFSRLLSVSAAKNLAIALTSRAVGVRRFAPRDQASRQHPCCAIDYGIEEPPPTPQALCWLSTA